MPSPFPGMDPFLEGQKWKTFHSRFVTAIGDALVPQVRPRYVVDVEDYVWIADEEDQVAILLEPDVALARPADRWEPPISGDTAATVAAPAVIRTIAAPERIRQKHVVIRNRSSLHVVTVIELLSPRNKRPGAGQREYLLKRQNILDAPASLVEIDLLRHGARLPTTEPLPPADCYAFVCRQGASPQVEVHSWTLQPLPPIPIPLAEGDADVRLDLQRVFETTYDRAGFDYALDYAQPVDPPLSEADSEWVREILATRVE